jgi:hypothetical protein
MQPLPQYSKGPIVTALPLFTIVLNSILVRSGPIWWIISLLSSDLSDSQQRMHMKKKRTYSLRPFLGYDRTIDQICFHAEYAYVGQSRHFSPGYRVV